jgi:type IV pilus assembly protein PilB
MSQDSSKIVNFLLKKGKLSSSQYEKILKELEKSKNDLSPDEFLEKKGIVSDEEIAKAKGELYSLPIADIYGLQIDQKVLNIIPEDVAENYFVLPFDKDNKILKVVILDPGDFRAREAVNFVARQKGLRVKYFVAPRSAFKKALAQYSGLDVEVKEAVGSAESRFAPTLDKGKGINDLGVGDISKTAPIAKLVGSILKYAVDNQVSDIHIEPFTNKSRVRYRIDGVLRETAMLPGYLHSAIISRIKVMSNLKLDETRVPQGGRIRIVISGRQIDLRVSVMPLLDNEKAVMRVLDPTRKIFTLQDLGFWGQGLDVIKNNLSKPHGMILITGPTGSGKTTTLYALLKILNQSTVNIVSLEDPIEYVLEGINQSQVRSDIGYSFASGLRSIVRQDPDVIMVGEIRDDETAELAVHAALTGHIVLSTLHANDAFGAIPRLMDMNVAPFLISSSLNTVVAQRLVRKICPHCREEITLSDSLEKSIEKSLQEKEIKDFNLEDYRDPHTGHLKFYRGAGCSRCNQEGYKGRLAVFEALDMTEPMKNIVEGGAKEEIAEKELERQNMIKMVRDGYIKALKGETTVEEVLRVSRE